MGEIPEHWTTAGVKREYEIQMGKMLQTEAKASTDMEVPYLKAVNVQWYSVQTEDVQKMWASKGEIEQLAVLPGDLLVCEGGEGGRAGIVTTIPGGFIIQNALHRVRSKKDAKTEFLQHLMRVISDSGWFEAINSKATIAHFTKEKFEALPIPVPSSEEQAAIARFLDHADEQIQRYIASKERLIALLEEERQALVHQAITRGLDPNVKLKPSGVEWLGDVPEHWSIRTLGQIADSFRTGPFGSMLHQSDYIEGGIPVINPIHIRGGVIAEDPSCSVSDPVAVRLSDYRLAKHDLVFSRRGELGRCSLVRDRETNWLCGTGSIRVRITYDGIDPEFVIQALQVQWVGEYLSHVSVGATMNNLNTGILKSIPILMPPLQEQGNILGHSTRQTSAIDVAMTSIRQMIGLLQEYRTRLIADVVTGQLDVREAAEELPTPEPTEITD